MKGERLGEFEELVLLAVCGRTEEPAYGASVQRRLEHDAERKAPIGAVYSALDRLERKGMVKSWVGGATEERGGRRKRFFEVTDFGREALQESYRIREKMWRAARGLQPAKGAM